MLAAILDFATEQEEENWKQIVVYSMGPKKAKKIPMNRS